MTLPKQVAPSALTAAQNTHCARARRLHTDTEALAQVTVITVTYNSAHCLPSLGASLKAFDNVIVVDNASNDECVERAPLFLPQANVIPLTNNMGFGAANNRGLAKVATPFALLLNPDCTITTEAVLQLVRTANVFPAAAIVAPQLVNGRGAFDVNYRWPHVLWRSRGPGLQNGAACVGFICGAAMLLRMEAIAPPRNQGAGEFFDERFFLYYEDDDLCTRLFNERKQLIVDPKSIAIHASRGSVRGRTPLKSEYIRGFHHVQSKLIYTQKYQGLEAARTQRRRLLLQTPLALIARLLLPSPKHIARMYGRLIGALKADTKLMP